MTVERAHIKKALTVLATILLALVRDGRAHTAPQNAAGDLGGTSWLVKFQGSGADAR
jgi:hypothetical protein